MVGNNALHPPATTDDSGSEFLEVIMKFMPRTFALILVTAFICVPLAQGQPARPGAQGVQQRLDFAEALRQGRALLRRGKADQALPLLETALKLATEANRPREIAAAHDAL